MGENLYSGIIQKGESFLSTDLGVQAEDKISTQADFLITVYVGGIFPTYPLPFSKPLFHFNSIAFLIKQKLETKFASGRAEHKHALEWLWCTVIQPLPSLCLIDYNHIIFTEEGMEKRTRNCMQKCIGQLPENVQRKCTGLCVFQSLGIRKEVSGLQNPAILMRNYKA